MKRINVVLVGDIDIREQSRCALAGIEEIEIVGELAAFEARHLRYVEETTPDVMVIDGAANDFDARTAISMIKRSGSVENLIVVAPSVWSKQEMVNSGVDAVVSTQEELQAAILPAAVHTHTSTTLGRAA